MKLTEHTKIRKEKFGAVVFETLTEKVFVADAVGAEILELITQRKTLPEILARLTDNYEADRQVIERDVAEFIEQLRSSKIMCS